ncbi:MAG: MraY family glycosyltransferase [Anaerolineales bacterium]|nr:MraY family glycosyltransferase [Anaerolineales bacterium]
MTQYLPIIIAAAVLAFLATPVTLWLARRWGLVDQPGLRKAHRAPTPLLGGLALYLGVTLAFIAFGQTGWVTEGIGILGGATLLFATGLWDDRFGMPAWLKLAACGVAALFLSAFGVRVQLFNLLWLDTAITVLWVVGITNAANLMDNMDGLAAGLTAVAAGFFFILAALEGQGLVASLAAALLGASAGFLFYNLAPAVSFMGDAGSLTLGFLLAALGIQIRFLNYPLASTWMAPIVVLGLFIFDTTLVTVSRLRRGRSPFQGGSDHISHRLTQLGLSKPRAVLTLYVAAFTLGATAITLTRLEPLAANTAFAALLVAGLLALLWFERIEPRLAGDPPLLLIPGGGGFVEAVQAALSVSQNVTVLVATGPGAPAREEVIETLAALAEEPAAVRGLLERGLGAEWAHDLPALGRALRLRGSIVAVNDETFAEVQAMLRKARLIVLGPGEAAINQQPVLAALRTDLERLPVAKVWAGSMPAANGALAGEVQRRLLYEAAGTAKGQRSDA